MKKIITTLTIALIASPLMTFAQVAGGGGAPNSGADFGSILRTIGGLINQVIPILILGGLAWFIFGVVRFVIAGDADKKAEARTIVIQGIIGLFVITSVWGLVFLFNRTFGVRSGGTITSGTPSICIPGTGDPRC